MTFDRSGTADAPRRFMELLMQAMRELERMEARPGFAPYFRVWDYDPQGTYRSWLIQVPDDGDPLQPDPLVLERTWEAEEDRERLGRDLRRRPRLEPTMYLRESRLPRAEFEFLRGVGKRIPFPLFELRDDHPSLQTVQYGIEGFRRETVRLRSERVRLTWGAVPPTGMKATATWAERVRGLCRSCFDGQVSILRSGATGLCSLCRGPSLEDAFACPVCRAAYHQECWDYVGRCAVYGCGGTDA